MPRHPRAASEGVGTPSRWTAKATDEGPGHPAVAERAKARSGTGDELATGHFARSETWVSPLCPDTKTGSNV